MRIVFAGTPDFAAASLAALIAAGHTIAAVFTQPDRPAGRGMKLTPSSVKLCALTHGIPVYQPHSLKLDGKYPTEAAAAQAALKDIAPDVMIVAAYGLILPQWALDLPTAGCVNLHASLLPRWRGAAPIQRAIQAGDTQSGVCLMDMELGLDTGGVYARSVVDITPSMTGAQLHDVLSASAAALICTHLADIVAGKLTAVPQPTDGIVYAHKLQRSDGALDWAQSAAVLANQVRAFDPTPGCSFEANGQTYKVWAATLVADEIAAGIEAEMGSDLQPGTVLKVSAQGVWVACGSDISGPNGLNLSALNPRVLNMTEIQKPGGKRLAMAEGWQAYSAWVGLRLSAPSLIAQPN